jgi:hypothetical protein
MLRTHTHTHKMTPYRAYTKLPMTDNHTHPTQQMQLLSVRLAQPAAHPSYLEPGPMTILPPGLLYVYPAQKPAAILLLESLDAIPQCSAWHSQHHGLSLYMTPAYLPTLLYAMTRNHPLCYFQSGLGAASLPPAALLAAVPDFVEAAFGRLAGDAASSTSSSSSGIAPNAPACRHDTSQQCMFVHARSFRPCMRAAERESLRPKTGRSKPHRYLTRVRCRHSTFTLPSMTSSPAAGSSVPRSSATALA